LPELNQKMRALLNKYVARVELVKRKIRESWHGINCRSVYEAAREITANLSKAEEGRRGPLPVFEPA
jgi:hypothetical protein